jgi:hypothetical protein
LETAFAGVAVQEIGHAGFQAIGKVEEAEYGMNDKAIQGGIEVTAFETEAIKPGSEVSGPAVYRARNAVSEGVLEGMVIADDAGRPNELEGAQAGVAD